MPIDKDGRCLVQQWKYFRWITRAKEIKFLLFDRWIYPFEAMAVIHANHILGVETTDDFFEWIQNRAINGGLDY